MRDAQEADPRKVRAAEGRSVLSGVLYRVTAGRLRLCHCCQDLPAQPSPAPLFPPLPLTTESLRTLRTQARRAADLAGLPEDRAADLLIAVGEASMNAIVHAEEGTAAVYADPDRGIVQVWVEDHGHGIAEDSLQRATLEPGFTTRGTLGQGFWLMLCTIDRLWLRTDGTGTTAVLEQFREDPIGAA